MNVCVHIFSECFWYVSCIHRYIQMYVLLHFVCISHSSVAENSHIASPQKICIDNKHACILSSLPPAVENLCNASTCSSSSKLFFRPSYHCRYRCKYMFFLHNLFNEASQRSKRYAVCSKFALQ
ncbi:unnamed protein product [Ceratitis capitata]|uniref:(Mediterranean fruit fly) hypothetical protein n=1 Tax=Ceratitis capitata TaxID=7213 RepID=A0A811UFM0_CERCA|nr:unnamed protein product [Ceratitis capitata]